MPQVVHANLGLKAILGFALWGVHHAGVVHQGVQPLVLGGKGGGEGPHRVQRSKVEGHHLNGALGGADARLGLFALFGSTAGEDDGGPLLGQVAYRDQANPGVAPGDNVGLAAQIAGEQLRGAHQGFGHVGLQDIEKARFRTGVRD